VVVAAQAINPERFGRYVLLDRIGEGGMAEVFRAIMPGAEGFKRTLVVKRILSPHSNTAAFVDMFVREARIGAMLSHPNIVQVYDFGSVDGHYFLAMEYLRGRDVLAIIKRLRDTKTPFPIPVAAFIAHEVAACLGYAHALTSPDGRCLDIVHRDVSPSNVMCLREGGVKLLDFGIAKAINECAPESTEQGVFKGKLAYTAPERMRSDNADGRSDLYSLGVVLWEMLACRRLFRGASDVDTFKNILEMKVPPPSTRRSDVPPSLDAIVMHAIERDPDKRYSSGRAMAEDLEEVLRETGFKTRMLPQMLHELFGTGLHSSQVALSQLTPELLAAASDGTNSGYDSLPLTGTTGRLFVNSWRLWFAIAATVAVAVLATYFIVRNGKSHSIASTVPALIEKRAATPAASAASQGIAPQRTQVSADVVEPLLLGGSSDQPLENAKKARKPAIGKRPAGTGPERNPIGRGLSVDPFKEAISRGSR
jgi:serine/threonine-protein kinase